MSHHPSPSPSQVAEMQRHGVDAAHHPRLAALAAPSAAAGFDWLTVLSLVQKYGPIAMQILEDLLAKQQPSTAKAP